MNEQGGISNGETINMRIAFKPTSTIGVSCLFVFFFFNLSLSLFVNTTKIVHSSMNMHICRKLLVIFVIHARIIFVMMFWCMLDKVLMGW